MQAEDEGSACAGMACPERSEGMPGTQSGTPALHTMGAFHSMSHTGSFDFDCTLVHSGVQLKQSAWRCQ